MIVAGYECTECFVHQVNKVISIACENKSESEKIEVFKKAMEFLSKIDFNNSPPEIARMIYQYLYKITENPDPFKELKLKTNKIAEKLAEKIFTKTHSLEDYVKYAIAGNVIDFGVVGNEFDIEKIKNFDLYINHFEEFIKILNNAKILLYIVDNSGEIIFDFHLLKRIKNDFSNIKIFIAARESNIINDITKNDLIELGYHNYFNVISTGYSGAGVLLEKCSKEFIDLFNSSDIIISKGQGNFETLFGEDRVNIFYALKIKCNHVAKATNIPKGSNVFIYNKK